MKTTHKVEEKSQRQPVNSFWLRKKKMAIKMLYMDDLQMTVELWPSIIGDMKQKWTERTMLR